jgi:tRNA-modifying protein YgfZ
MQAAPPSDEIISGTAPSGRVALTHLGVIRARGADAAKFLHGQLTQDVNSLGPDHARLAGFCSAKGRLLASFVIWRPEPETVLLALSADLLAPTLKRLSMFVLRAQCKLDDASADWALHAVFGPAAEQALGAAAPALPWACADLEAGARAIRLPTANGEAHFLLAMPTAAPSAIDALPEHPLAAWHLRCVRAGLPWITAATTEQFVPQMVNLELVGGVNFQKGCYPGQEVVARSQYRGTLKRRMQLFRCPATVQAGQEILHSEDPGQPAGMVVNVGTDGAGDTWLLAEVKLAALGTGRLHLGAVDGPALVRAALPYTLPQEAADAPTA